MSELLPHFREWADRFLFPLDDPGSRLFGLNLLGALLLVAAHLWWSVGRVGWADLRALLCRRRYWWNSSTKHDYALYLLNSGLKLFFVAPFLKISFLVSAAVLGQGSRVFGSVPEIGATPGALLVFSFCAFVFDDFLRFAHHWLMHHVPFLWRLHEVHHSAHVLTPLTLFRIHPLESALATFRNALSAGVAMGCFLFFFRAEASLATLVGGAGFGWLFNVLGANLRHSHVALSFGPFEKIFLSPAQHQLHHSRAHRNVNLGVSLAIWDGLLGSLAHYRPGEGRLRFGLRVPRGPARTNLSVAKIAERETARA